MSKNVQLKDNSGNVLYPNTTISQVDSLTSTLSGKQSSLSTAQLNACNSGVTSDKISTYDGVAINDENVVNYKSEQNVS